MNCTFLSLRNAVGARVYFLLVTLWLVGADAFAQRELGVHLAFPFAHERLPEGREYRPYQLLLHYHLTDLAAGARGVLSLSIEPQFVWVHFLPKGKKEWEAGANLSVVYRRQLSTAIALHAAIGSGPHYISVRTTQQSRGFIFSDNFTAGVSYAVPAWGLQFDARCRFRHISNAGIQEPNKGIDSWFVVLGVRKAISRKM